MVAVDADYFYHVQLGLRRQGEFWIWRGRGGMAKDLNITPGLASLIGALFFLGYFFFQIPGANYAKRRSARTLIFWSMILWGILAAATGVVRSVPLLLIVRFLLGVVESAVFPGLFNLD